MKTIPGLSDDDGTQLIAKTLSLFVGAAPHHFIKFEELAAITGDKPGTLRSYASGECRMPGPVMMRVFSVLPPEAFGRLCNRMGFATPAPLDVDDGATVRRALTEASRLVTEGNEALEDNHLDHRERAMLAERATTLIPILQVVAGGKI